MRTKPVQRKSEITEFVIISGPEVHDYLVDVRLQLRSYLRREFPEYQFSLLSQEGEGMGFVVVPVVGSIGGDEDEPMADPKASVLWQIRQVLEAFQPKATAVH